METQNISDNSSAKMTLADYIEELKGLPQKATVEMFYLDYSSLGYPNNMKSSNFSKDKCK